MTDRFQVSSDIVLTTFQRERDNFCLPLTAVEAGLESEKSCQTSVAGQIEMGGQLCAVEANILKDRTVSQRC